MKVKVVEAFKDKTADLISRKKDEIMDVTDARAAELIALGKVVAVEGEDPDNESEDPDNGIEDPDNGIEDLNNESKDLDKQVKPNRKKK